MHELVHLPVAFDHRSPCNDAYGGRGRRAVGLCRCFLGARCLVLHLHYPESEFREPATRTILILSLRKAWHIATTYLSPRTELQPPSAEVTQAVLHLQRVRRTEALLQSTLGESQSKGMPRA
jgi:hypothetical protein